MQNATPLNNTPSTPKTKARIIAYIVLALLVAGAAYIAKEKYKEIRWNKLVETSLMCLNAYQRIDKENLMSDKAFVTHRFNVFVDVSYLHSTREQLRTFRINDAAGINKLDAKALLEFEQKQCRAVYPKLKKEPKFQGIFVDHRHIDPDAA